MDRITNKDNVIFQTKLIAKQSCDVLYLEQALFPRTSASSAKRCTEAARPSRGLRLTQMVVDMILFG